MSTIDPSDAPPDQVLELRQWASRSLEFDLTDDPERLRRKAFLRIEEAEFQVPTGRSEMLDAVFRPPQTFRWDDWPEFQYDVEEQVAREVELLAAKILELDPIEREARWQALNSRCENFPVLRRRMIQLLPALRIDDRGPPLPEGRAEELGRLALQLVPLPFSERNQTRIAAIETMHSDPDSWEAAAQKIQRDFPRICALAPELFEEVSRFSSMRESAATARRRRQVRQNKQRSPDPELVQSGGSGSPVWIYIFLGTMVLRVIAAGFQHASNPRPPTIPSYHSLVPAVPNNQNENSNQQAQQEFMRKLLEGAVRTAIEKKLESGEPLSPREEEFLRRARGPEMPQQNEATDGPPEGEVPASDAEEAVEIDDHAPQ